jgi:hypothetical protein
MTTAELAMNVLLSFVAIAFFVILYKGYRNDLVIYQDGKDFMRTMMIAILIMASPFLFDASWIENSNIEFCVTWILTPLFTLLFIVLVIDSFYLSITNNQNAYVVGSLIAVFRVFYLLLALLLILKLIDYVQKSRTYRSTVFNLALAGSVGYGLYLLVNGKAVENKRVSRSDLNGILE